MSKRRGRAPHETTFAGQVVKAARAYRAARRRYEAAIDADNAFTGGAWSELHRAGKADEAYAEAARYAREREAAFKAYSAAENVLLRLCK